MNAVRVSVVIPTLNEEKYIEPLLKSLKPQLKRGDELIVVDSHSADKTVKIARKYTKKIFFMPHLGIGPAKTFGARRAKNEIVAFVDADSVVCKTWLDGIKTAFKNGANVFGGRRVYSSNNKIKRLFYELESYGFFLWSVLFSKLGISGIVSSNNCAFHKNIFFEAGGFKPIVCEDFNIGVRLKNMKNIKYCYDINSVVHISSRRFDKNGFIKTNIGWSIQTIRILTTGYATDSRRYEIVTGQSIKCDSRGG